MNQSVGRPPVWRMLQEAMAALGGDSTNVNVRDWILQRYPGTNTNTIQTQIGFCTVNNVSRIHGPENHRLRRAEDQRYDFLYRPERGQLETYDPLRHGFWEIREAPSGKLEVGRVDDPAEDEGSGSPAPPPSGGTFAAEDHLRDYLALNLHQIEAGLEILRTRMAI